MKCHVCGSEMDSTITNLPFKINELTIVIVKDLPVFQCGACSECLLEDHVLAHLENLFDKVNKKAELDILKYQEAA
ncbi:MAG: YgiT-type zinc finger protein [Desulfosalsimonadaceae bacterium]